MPAPEDSSSYPLPDAIRAREGDFVTMASDHWDALVIQDTRVFKAGNSLAIRIPSAIVKHCQLEEGGMVEMVADNGMIYVRKPRPLELNELIAGITPDNLHGAEFENLIGAELW